MTHPRLLRAATAALLALGLSAVGAQAAFAADVDPASDSSSAPEAATDPTPYKLLAWQLPCGVADVFCAPGQKLVHVLDLEVPTLDALDSLVVGTCGDWQIDLENDSTTTDALIAAGVLAGPNDPVEDHAYGALGQGVDPFKTIDNADCAVEGSIATNVTVTDQTCNSASQLVGGQITAEPTDGVTYSLSGPDGAITLDAAGAAAGLAPGAYSVAYTLAPGFTTPDPGPVPLTVAAFGAACIAGTAVTPPGTATVTPPTTAVTPSDPASVAASSACSTGTALAASDCQLTTLALTGSAPSAIAASAAALILAGAALTVLRLRLRRRAQLS